MRILLNDASFRFPLTFLEISFLHVIAHFHAPSVEFLSVIHLLVYAPLLALCDHGDFEGSLRHPVQIFEPIDTLVGKTPRIVSRFLDNSFRLLGKLWQSPCVLLQSFFFL